MEFLWKLSEIRTDFGETFFGFITRFGEETFILFFVCLTYWCLNKELAYRIGIAFFFSGAATQMAKVTFRIDRPWILDENFLPAENAVKHATGYSFPSGHTQAATSLYSSVAFYFKNVWIKSVCFLLISAVGFSRMYLGVHTPQDVITAFLLSVIVSAAVNFYLCKFSSKKTDMILCMILAVFAVICFVYPYTLYTKSIIELKYASDCAKQAGATLAFAIGFFAERNYIHYEIPEKISHKLIVFAVGLTVTLALKSGLKPILGSSITADTLRYFITVLWVTVLYPIVVKKALSPDRKR